jgi:hypothetical protein
MSLGQRLKAYFQIIYFHEERLHSFGTVVLTRSNPEQKRNYWIVQIQCTEESVIEEQMNLPASVLSEINVLYSYRFSIGLEMHIQVLNYNMV